MLTEPTRGFHEDIPTGAFASQPFPFAQALGRNVNPFPQLRNLFFASISTSGESEEEIPWDVGELRPKGQMRFTHAFGKITLVGGQLVPGDTEDAGELKPVFKVEAAPRPEAFYEMRVSQIEGVSAIATWRSNETVHAWTMITNLDEDLANQVYDIEAELQESFSERFDFYVHAGSAEGLRELLPAEARVKFLRSS